MIELKRGAIEELKAAQREQIKKDVKRLAALVYAPFNTAEDDQELLELLTKESKAAFEEAARWTKGERFAEHLARFAVIDTAKRLLDEEEENEH